MPSNVETWITDSVIVEESAYCHSCGREDASDFCAECKELHCAACTECKKVVPKWLSKKLSDSQERVCQECLEKRYTRCNYCRNHYAIEKVLTTRIDHSTWKMCLKCIQREVVACDECKAPVFTADSTLHKNKRYCHACLFIYPIESYSYRPPRFKYFHTSKTKRQNKDPFYGIEIEVIASNSPQEVRTEFSISNRDEESSYLKYDGSLGDNGVEVVFHPHTMSALKNSTILRDVLKWGAKGVAYAWNGSKCGLHIHSEKKDWSRVALYKLYTLMSKNVEFWTWLSGRKKSHMSYCILENIYHNRIVQYAKYKGDGCGASKYVALNMNNEHTIEFRLFRGSLSKATFWKNLECVDSLRYFCNTYGSIAQFRDSPEAVLKSWVAMVYENRKDYPNLYKWLYAREEAYNKILRKEEKKEAKLEVNRTVQHLHYSGGEYTRTEYARVEEECMTA